MENTIHIELDSQTQSFVDQEIKSGEFNSVSDLVKDAIQLLVERRKARIQLDRELDKGRESGIVEDFDPKENLRELHRRYL